jgi:hypothetical protein
MPCATHGHVFDKRNGVIIAKSLAGKWDAPVRSGISQ